MPTNAPGDCPRRNDFTAAFCKPGPITPASATISASLLKDQGRLEEAAATFQRVLAVKPDDALAHCNLGNVLQLQGQAGRRRRHATGVRSRCGRTWPWRTATSAWSCAKAITWRKASRRSGAMPSWLTGAESPRRRQRAGPAAQGAARPRAAGLPQRQRRSRPAARAPAARFRLEEGGRVAGHAVNPDASGGEIAARWREQPAPDRRDRQSPDR